ncbi:MAG: hypothetical protein PHH77_05270 [Victivallaceae bacterium]|nr:hypothetical protein [Victivallaceae bacterium]
MPKFDDKIKIAIEKAVKRDGSQFALCKKMGISISIMSRYLKGNVKTINAGTWNMIFPFIKEYLPEDYHRTFNNWKSKEEWEKFYKEHPEARQYANKIDNHNTVVDFQELSKTDPLYGRSREFINTIKLITEKLPYLSQKTLNKFLVEAINEIEAKDKD